MWEDLRWTFQKCIWDNPLLCHPLKLHCQSWAPLQKESLLSVTKMSAQLPRLHETCNIRSSKEKQTNQTKPNPRPPPPYTHTQKPQANKHQNHKNKNKAAAAKPVLTCLLWLILLSKGLVAKESSSSGASLWSWAPVPLEESSSMISESCLPSLICILLTRGRTNLPFKP